MSQVLKSKDAKHKTFEEYDNEIKINFDSDQTYQALLMLQELQILYAEGQLKSQNEEMTIDKQYQEFQEQFHIKRLLRNQEINRLRFTQIQGDLPNWEKFIDEPGKKLYFKNEKGYKFLTQFIELELEANYMDLLVLFHEADLMKKWVPTVTQSDILLQYNSFRQLMYQQFNPPWPFKAREAYIEIAAWEVPEEQILVFSFDSVPEGDWLGVNVKKNPKLVEMKWSSTFGYVKAISKDRTLFRYIIQADPQFEFLPQNIIDWALRTVTGGALSFIQRTVKHLPDHYVKRRDSRKEYYQDIFDKTKSLREVYENGDIQEEDKSSQSTIDNQQLNSNEQPQYITKDYDEEF